MGVIKEWEAFGLKCRILDGPFGNMNGYVAVPRGHPMFEVDYGKLNINVHGGLTFGSKGGLSNDPKWKDKELNWPNPDLYWFGFDTAHLGDWVNYHSNPSDHKWTLKEVIEETENMARQFSEMHYKLFLDYSAKYEIEKFYGKDFLEKLLLGEAGIIPKEGVQ